MRKPGAALTSTMPPPVSRTEREMSGDRKSIPATSRPITAAACSAMATLSGWISSVLSTAVPPVDRLAVAHRVTVSPGPGTLSRVRPLRARKAAISASGLIRVITVSCPSPRRGSRLTASISAAMDRAPSPTTAAATRSATATTSPPTTRIR